MKKPKNRIESFSDGVIAIIITIMVLNIPIPTNFESEELIHFLEALIVYFISFVIVANFWNQHKNLFDSLINVNARVIWLNTLFLFFLSLVPLFTKWIIQNPSEAVPAVGYGVVLLLVSTCNITMVLYEKNFEVGTKKKIVYFRTFIIPLVTLAIILLAFFYPRISTLFFIVLPVISSITNLRVDKSEKRKKLEENQ